VTHNWSLGKRGANSETDFHRSWFFIFEEEKGKMSQICNFFSLFFMTFQDLDTYNFTIAGVDECGKEAVTTSAVVHEVDWATGYYDNLKNSGQSFLCGYL